MSVLKFYGLIPRWQWSRVSCLSALRGLVLSDNKTLTPAGSNSLALAVRVALNGALGVPQIAGVARSSTYN